MVEKRDGNYFLGSETEQTAVRQYDYDKFIQDLENQFPPHGLFALNSPRISGIEELNPKNFVAIH